MLTKLILQSMWARRTSLGIVIVSSALGIGLIAGGWAMESALRKSFVRTLAGTDLIVGARGSPTNLLLSSVFGFGSPLGLVSWSAHERLAALPEVAWTLPISLGDTHRSFRVLATDQSLFQKYQFGDKETLTFAAGSYRSEPFTAAIGSEVARELNYAPGKKILLKHAESMLHSHDDAPFIVKAVLQKTMTPLDRTIIISHESMEAMHHDAEIKGVSAILIKLKSRPAVLQVQHIANSQEDEALTAIIPAVTLSDLWQQFSYIRIAFQIMSGLLLLVSLACIILNLYSTALIRKREMAVLRSLGASPQLILLMYFAEAFVCVTLSTLLALTVLKLGFFSLHHEFANFIDIFNLRSFSIYGAIALISGALSFIAAWQAYQRGLQDALTLEY